MSSASELFCTVPCHIPPNLSACDFASLQTLHTSASVYHRLAHFKNVSKIRLGLIGLAEANDSMVIYPSSTSPRFAYVACVARFAVASAFCQFARRCLCYFYKLLSLLVFWNQFVYAVDSGGALTSCKSHANQRSTFVCRAIVVAFPYCSSAFALEL